MENSPKSAKSTKSNTNLAERTKNVFKINKKTLPLKMVLFLFCGAMAAILPYLTIHMREIGITIEEVAIIYAVLPFTSFLGPPLMGFLADKFGQYKIVLILATFANGLFHTLLLAVPHYREIPVEGLTYISWSYSSTHALMSPVDSTLCSPFLNAFSGDNEIASVISNCESIFNNGSSKVRCFTNESKRTFNKLECREPTSDIEFQDIIHDESYVLKFSILRKEQCAVNFNLEHTISLEDEVNFRCLTNLTFPTGEIISEGSNAETFWIYFILRILATLFMTSCFSLLDAATLAMVKNSDKAEYGKERIWSVIGFGAVSPLAGLLVDQVTRSHGPGAKTDYSAAFFVSNVLLVLNILTYVFMKLHVEKPEAGIGKNILKLLKYPEVVVFLVMIFVLGTMWGFVEAYLFIFLKELHAPNYLLGLTLTVGSLAGIPFSYGSEKILVRFGRVNIIILAFLTYFVRFFGYSYLKSPFWCFPFEAMEAFTYHTMWIAAATYCSELAPKGLLATLMGVMGSLHYSLGKGNGAFIGGYLMGAVGTRMSFRYFGIVAGIFGIIYLILNAMWLQKLIRRRHALENTEASVDDPEIIYRSVISIPSFPTTPEVKENISERTIPAEETENEAMLPKSNA